MISILGAGAVGSFLAQQLAPFSPGLELLKRSSEGISPDCRFLLLACKAFDLPSAVPWAQEKLGKRAAPPLWIFCQNGLGILDQIGPETVPESQRGRMACWFGARWQEEGAGKRKIISTPLPRISLACPDSILFERLRQAGFIVEDAGFGPHALQELEWRKALLNLSINALCTREDIPNGAILRNPILRQEAAALFKEAIAVARAQGFLSDPPPIESLWQQIEATSTNFNSMLQDKRAGRRSEFEWLNPTLVKQGRLWGIEVPTHEALVRTVSP